MAAKSTAKTAKDRKIVVSRFPFVREFVPAQYVVPDQKTQPTAPTVVVAEVEVETQTQTTVETDLRIWGIDYQLAQKDEVLNYYISLQLFRETDGGTRTPIAEMSTEMGLRTRVRCTGRAELAPGRHRIAAQWQIRMSTSSGAAVPVDASSALFIVDEV